MTTRLFSLPQTMGEMAMQCIIDSSLHELNEIKFPSIEYSIDCGNKQDISIYIYVALSSLF